MHSIGWQWVETLVQTYFLFSVRQADQSCLEVIKVLEQMAAAETRRLEDMKEFAGMLDHLVETEEVLKTRIQH